MGTSSTQILSEFKSELGGDFVNVEISEAAFSNVMKVSKRWFNARKGFIISRPVQIIDGQLEYQMKPDVLQVLDVIFQVPTDVAAFFTLGFFDIIPYGPNTLGSVGSGLTNYSGFAQLLQFTEQRKRIFSVEPDWYFEQQSGILHITARGGTPSGTMLIQVKTTDWDSAHLSDKDDYIFVRYVKARCKDLVGKIRSKYDSLPAAGGPVTLDGPKLVEEAKEEIEKLEIEIFSSQGPDGFIAG